MTKMYFNGEIYILLGLKRTTPIYIQTFMCIKTINTCVCMVFAFRHLTSIHVCKCTIQSLFYINIYLFMSWIPCGFIDKHGSTIRMRSVIIIGC